MTIFFMHETLESVGEPAMDARLVYGCTTSYTDNLDMIEGHIDPLFFLT